MSLVKYQGADIKQLAESLKSEFARGSIKMETFKLTAPISASIKLKDGQYRKTSFIGGEEFRIISSYVGKRGDIIVAFAPKSLVNYVQMELTLDEAMRVMPDRFNELVNAQIQKFLELSGELEEIATKNKAQVNNDSRVKQMEDPRYGAW